MVGSPSWDVGLSLLIDSGQRPRMLAITFHSSETKPALGLCGWPGESPGPSSGHSGSKCQQMGGTRFEASVLGKAQRVQPGVQMRGLLPHTPPHCSLLLGLVCRSALCSPSSAALHREVKPPF